MWQAEDQDGIKVVAWQPAIAGAEVRWDELSAAMPTRAVATVVDIDGIKLITSESLAAIVGAVRRVQIGGGKMVFARPSPLVAQIVRSMRLDRLVPLHDSVAAAVAALR